MVNDSVAAVGGNGVNVAVDVTDAGNVGSDVGGCSNSEDYSIVRFTSL